MQFSHYSPQDVVIVLVVEVIVEVVVVDEVVLKFVGVL